MKKTLAILLVLAMVLSMIPLSGVFAATADTLYLKPNANWVKDNARFAAYFFGNGEKWVSMTDSDSDGIYEVTVPAGYPKVIFCRMKPNASANNWNNKWNQTADLTVPSNGNNYYTVKENTWDNGGGTWSVFGSGEQGGGSETPPPASDPVYRVVGSAGLCGSGWNITDDNNKMEKQADGTYKKVYTDVAAGTYELKVVMDGSTWIPDGTDNNISVTALEGATVTVTYDPNNTATPVTAVAEGGTEPAVPVEHVYRVVGAGGLCGSEWNTTDDNNKMEKQADGTYKKVYTDVAAGTYKLKVVMDGSTWIPGGTGNDISVTALEGATVTVTYDPNNTATTVTAVAEGGTESSTPTEDTYHLVGFGSVFTQEWTVDGGHLMTKGDDGLYSVVFENVAAGDLGFKVVKNNETWIPEGMGNETKATSLEGSKITVTFDPATSQISVKVEGGTQPDTGDDDDQGGSVTPPATEDTYHLVGSGSVFTQEWAVAGGHLMIKGDDGLYSVVFENVAAGDLGFKVVKNNETWIPDGMGNETKATSLEGSKITVTFDPATSEISVKVEGGTEPDTGDDDDDQGGTVTPPASTYYVAGNTDLTGVNWKENDTNNVMTEASGKFSKTYTGLQPGKKYEFKITDGTWTNSWGIGDNKSDNYVFAVSAESSVTITFDPATKEITVTGDKLTAYVPEVTSATVVGSKGLCGGAADWATENDGAMVKGTDGKFTKVFSNVAAGNYECKVLTNNGDWYPGSNVSVAVSANGSTVTVTFDPAAGTVTASVQAPEGGDQDDDQGGTVTPPPATNDVYHVVGSGSIFAADWTIADADKMEKQSDGTYKKVYTGVAKGNLGIKVVKNNTTWIPDGFDNEIKAEVTADNSTVTVTYNPTTGKIDVKINDKAAGSATGTPEGGNSGNSGTIAKEITVYAKVPSHWTAPKVWAWKGTQNVATTGWPGELNMTKGANGWWSIKITSDIEGVLICNAVEGGVEQTADVKVTTAGADIYVTVGEKQADGKYAATATFESVPSNGDETNLFGMVIVMMAAVLGMGVTVVSKKKFF